MTSLISSNNFRNMLGPIALAITIILSFTLSENTYGKTALLSIAIYIAGISILNRNKFPYSPIHLFTFLFIFYIVINPFWSIDYYRSISHIIVLCQIPLFFLLLSTDKIQKSWSNYLLLMAIPALISSIWGILDYAQTNQFTFGMRFYRVTGFLYDANSFAAIQYIFSILLFSLLHVHTPAKPLSRWSVWFIQFLVIATLILTLSRSGIVIWLLFMFSVYIFAQIKNLKKLKKHVILHLIIALLSFMFIQILISQVQQPLVRNDLPDGMLTSNLNGRLEVWRPTIKLFTEKPLLGWGLNSYPSLYPSIRNEHYSSGSVAHNDYIQFALEGGIVLLLFLLTFLVFHIYVFIRLLFHKCSNTDFTTEVELALMLFANLALLIHSVTNFSFYIIQLCILSGIIFSRSYYLAINLGFVKQPVFINHTKSTKRVSILILTIIMGTILYKSTSGFLFIDSDRNALTRSLSTNKILLNIFTSISPLDYASSTKLVASLTSQLNTISNARKKKQIVDFSILILESLTKEYPYDPSSFYRLGYLLKFAYLRFPEYHDEYKHYADLWTKSIEINPMYVPPYLRLSEDLNSRKEYRKALSLMEKLVPSLSIMKNVPTKDILLIRNLLMELAEKTGDDLLPLYKKLSLSAKQGDNEKYHDTLREINQRLKSRKNTPEPILPSAPSPGQSQLSLPQEKS